MSGFELHPRLTADTRLIGDLSLCRVLLMNDARYPWVILVPRRADMREIHHLASADRIALLEESCQLADCLERLFKPDKMNVAAIGNIVPQLHLHHVCRFRGDPAWPAPVWGHSPAVAYTPESEAQRLATLRSALGLES
ncbi:MAG: HIT domain-containing protein [Chromatiales bacterium]|nr:HIT domain-containing protein [Chromatiales bacterium]